MLLARAGVSVTVVEKHADFLRDFRGDTVHPSTLEIFHEIGLLDELLKLRHSRIDHVGLRMKGQEWKIADFRSLDVAAPFIAMMPQWDLLDFIAEKARRYPTFELRMKCEAVGAIFDVGGRVCGVELAGGEEISAGLVIAADGRRSILREKAELPLEVLGAPMDVFWFRLDKPAGMKGETFGAVGADRFLVLIDRRDYYQCAFPFPKGQAERVRAEGLEAFRKGIADLVPELAQAAQAITDWDQVKLLDVALDRLTQWSRPGLLAIGDAAHAMSPIGGVGINLAVQDAVAAANVLGAALARGENPDPLLANVQAIRWNAVRRMQALQKTAQDRVIAPLLTRKTKAVRVPLPVRVLDAIAPLRRVPGRIIGLGFDRVGVKSPNAFPEIGG